MQNPVQNDAGGIAFGSPTVGIFDLSQYLGFSHDHGIEAGCHSEKVADRILVTVCV